MNTAAFLLVVAALSGGAGGRTGALTPAVVAGLEAKSPAVPQSQLSTEDAKKIAAEVKAALKDNKTVQVGLSLGWRALVRRKDSQFRDVAVGSDGLLLLDQTDRSSVVLSGVVTAYPFSGANKRRKNLGFVANINLADFSADSVGVFNKSIEGGLGLAWRLNSEFSVAVTLERAFSRSLRNGVDLSKPILGADGKPLTSVDRSDSRYFHEDNVTAVSIKWVYLF